MAWFVPVALAGRETQTAFEKVQAGSVFGSRTPGRTRRTRSGRWRSSSRRKPSATTAKSDLPGPSSAVRARRRRGPRVRQDAEGSHPDGDDRGGGLAHLGRRNGRHPRRVGAGRAGPRPGDRRVARREPVHPDPDRVAASDHATLVASTPPSSLRLRRHYGRDLVRPRVRRACLVVRPGDPLPGEETAGRRPRLSPAPVPARPEPRRLRQQERIVPGHRPRRAAVRPPRCPVRAESRAGRLALERRAGTSRSSTTDTGCCTPSPSGPPSLLSARRSPRPIERAEQEIRLVP